MKEEKKRILDMLEDGKISAGEAAQLLEGLGEQETSGLQTFAKSGERMLRVRVISTERDNPKPTKVELNLPLALAKAVGRVANMIPEKEREKMQDKGVDLSGIDWEEMINALADVGGDIVNVNTDDEDSHTVVRIYVE